MDRYFISVAAILSASLIMAAIRSRWHRTMAGGLLRTIRATKQTCLRFGVWICSVRNRIGLAGRRSEVGKQRRRAANHPRSSRVRRAEARRRGQRQKLRKASSPARSSWRRGDTRSGRCTACGTALPWPVRQGHASPRRCFPLGSPQKRHYVLYRRSQHRPARQKGDNSHRSAGGRGPNTGLFVRPRPCRRP